MECKDKNCPTHGTLAARGLTLEGIVVSAKMQKTAIVQREDYIKIKKYQRYKKSTSRIPAHNPPCINAVEGDKVRVMECRKLGRTVNFVIMEKISGKKKPEDNAAGTAVEETVLEKHEEAVKKKTTKRKVKVKNG